MKQRVTSDCGGHDLLQKSAGGAFCGRRRQRTILGAMKLLVVIVLALALSPALAQPGPGRGHDLRTMPAPERRMSWEDRQRLREQIRSGSMTREQARERWREERERRGMAPGRSPEERQRLRRDVQEAGRELEKR